MHPATDESVRLVPHAVVLQRSPNELQVGVEPSVVVPLAWAGLVRALAAGVETGRLRQTATAEGVEPDALPRLLEALDHARLLRVGGPSLVPSTSAVRVVGAGRLGARVAHELLLAGFRGLYVADLPERPTSASRRTRARRRDPGGAGPGALDRVDVLVATLADLRADVRVRRSRHFLKPEGAAVALTVVVADGPEPDRLVPDLLREHGAPHLLVRCSGDEAVVGPLVVPSATSCVRCADLARRDADPCWPALLDQLTRLVIEPAPTLLAWAAVTAAVQALAFAADGRPETLGHTLELGGPEHAMRLRPWPAHAECPCRWDDTATSLRELR